MNQEPPEGHVFSLTYERVRDDVGFEDEKGAKTVAGLVLWHVEENT